MERMGPFSPHQIRNRKSSLPLSSSSGDSSLLPLLSLAAIDLHTRACCHCMVFELIVKKIKAVGTNEAQVVMHCLQVIDHCALILPFFPTPWAEGQTAPPPQGFW